MDDKASESSRVLVVDDEPSLVALERELLESAGYVVGTASSGQEAVRKARETHYDVAVIDLNMPGMTGFVLLEKLVAIDHDMQIIILTGYGDVTNVVRSIKQGAHDFLTKPLQGRDLLGKIETALLSTARRKSQLRPTAKRNWKKRLGSMLGASSVMQEIYKRIEEVAHGSGKILLLGEVGTGKQIVAREIHGLSPRWERPFLSICCTGLSEKELDGELFGREQGVFPETEASRLGVLEAAEEGTVFLDQVGGLRPQTQLGLLEVVQQGEVRRLGSAFRRPVGARLISSLNLRPSRDETFEGLREDLGYHLSRVIITLPPLRERTEDIPQIAANYLGGGCKKLAKQPRRLSPKALDKLCRHSWPGNMLQLQTVVERAVSLSRSSVISPKDISECFSLPGPRSNAGIRMVLEDQHFKEVLMRCGGDKDEAARILGIPQTSLHDNSESPPAPILSSGMRPT